MADRDDKPSKTQRKKQVEALQALGEELIDLPAAVLAEIPMPEALEEAVMAARRMNKRGALHRQRQYIGKIMRQIDAAPIAEALARIRDKRQTSASDFRRIERWRDRLLEEGDAAISELLDQVTGADVPHLRRLVRQASAEAGRGAPPKSARALFRYLRELLSQSE